MAGLVFAPIVFQPLHQVHRRDDLRTPRRPYFIFVGTYCSFTSPFRTCHIHHHYNPKQKTYTICNTLKCGNPNSRQRLRALSATTPLMAYHHPIIFGVGEPSKQRRGAMFVLCPRTPGRSCFSNNDQFFSDDKHWEALI